MSETDVGELSPNTIRHIAGCGLVKGPDEERIILVKIFFIKLKVPVLLYSVSALMKYQLLNLMIFLYQNTVSKELSHRLSYCLIFDSTNKVGQKLTIKTMICQLLYRYHIPFIEEANVSVTHSLPLGKARTLMTKKKETTTTKPIRRLLSACSSSLNKQYHM